MRRRRLTTALLTIEVALTMVLLAGAGLMMRSFLAVYRADSVVDAARVVAMPLSLPTEKYLRCAWASPNERPNERRIRGESPPPHRLAEQYTRGEAPRLRT